MKKYFLFAALSISALAFSQSYPYGYQDNSAYGQNYGYQDDIFGNDFYNYAYNNFPDDYFYDYPSDYYPAAYYQSYYNDYRNSIAAVNWNRLFSQYRISPAQARLVIELNNRFNSFSAWNSFYGMNPDRWYYDRFYALERILGPQIIVVIQNQYYGGYNPVNYFQNYRRTYYQPRYAVIPKYRNVNVNVYHINRDRYFRNQGYQANGWNNSNANRRNQHDPGGFRTVEPVQPSSRIGSTTQASPQRETRNMGGFRTENSQRNSAAQSPRISENSGMRNGEMRSPQANRAGENRSVRTTSDGMRSGGGFRN